MNIGQNIFGGYGKNIAEQNVHIENANHTRQSDTVNSQTDIAGLKEGAVFKGEILDIAGDKVTISLDNNVILPARMQGDISLTVGDILLFSVKENNQSQVMIKPVFDSLYSAETQTLEKILDLAGLSPTEKNFTAAKELMEAGMPVDKGSLVKLLSQSMKFEGTSMQTLAAMNKMNIPVTEANIAQYERYQNYSHQLTGDIIDTADSMADFAKSFPAGTEGNTLVSVAEKILDIILPETENAVINSENPAAQSKNASTVLESPTAQSENAGIVLESPAAQSEDAGAALENLAAQPEKSGAVSENPAAQPEKSGTSLENPTVQPEKSGVALENPTAQPKNSGEALNNTVTQPEYSNKVLEKPANEPQNSGIMEDRMINSEVEEYKTQVRQTDGEKASAKLNNPQIIKEELTEAGQIEKGREQTSIPKSFLQGLEHSLQKAGIPDEQIKNMFQSSNSHEELLRQITQSLSSLNGNETAIRAILESSEYRKLVSDIIKNNWAINPKSMKDPKEIDELYSRILKHSKAFEEAVAAKGGDTREFSENSRNMRQNMKFIEDLNQQMIYAQMPLKLSNRNANSELYVYADKRKLMKKKDGISVMLHLDMDNLGTTDIKVTLTGSNVNARFYLNDQESVDIVANNMTELAKQLADRGFSLTNKVIKREPQQSVNQVVDEIIDENAERSIKRYTFDARM